MSMCAYMYEMENKNTGHNTANQGINLILRVFCCFKESLMLLL